MGERDRWLPRHARDDPEAAQAIETLHGGIPPWLRGHLDDWLRQSAPVDRFGFWEGRPHLRLQAAFGTTLPIHVSGLDAEQALDVIDYLLAEGGVDPTDCEELEQLLSEGRSAWRATPHGLQRRVEATLQRGVARVVGAPGRPGRYLEDAWQKAWGRRPDASGAYRAAVQAVEASYQPIVSPRNKRTTLGGLIRDIEGAPTKFRVRFQGDGPEENVHRLVAMLRLLWRSQWDRHGIVDEDVPLHVSLDEARDAVALSASLVHLAQDGGFIAAGA
ncbi:MAG: hypothetical protein F4150_09335 [Chloroflexi bacterium]|nr:hypothetical protein [Chloroflexota bacterium]